jgi:hypothetical protein
MAAMKMRLLRLVTCLIIIPCYPSMGTDQTLEFEDSMSNEAIYRLQQEFKMQRRRQAYKPTMDQEKNYERMKDKPNYSSESKKKSKKYERNDRAYEVDDLDGPIEVIIGPDGETIVDHEKMKQKIEAAAARAQELAHEEDGSNDFDLERERVIKEMEKNRAHIAVRLLGAWKWPSLHK